MLMMTVLAGSIYSQEHGQLSPGDLIKNANHCFEQRKYDSALLLYKAFLTQSEESFDIKNHDTRSGQEKKVEAQVSMQIANICTLKKEFEQAESWYNNALGLAGSSKILKAEIYQNLGSLFYLKEHYENAILYYQRAWILYSREPTENSGRIADLLTSLGTAYSGNEDYQKSLICFRKADSVLNISGGNVYLKRAALNINIGEVLVKLNAPEKALLRYRSANELASGTSLSSLNIMISSNEGMAECYSRLGQSDSAMACLEKCLVLVKQTGMNMNRDSSRIYLFMGDVQARQKEWERSLAFFERASATLVPDSINLSLNDSYVVHHWSLFLDLYKIYERMGRSRLQSAIQSGSDTVSLLRAYVYFSNALKICDRISRDFGHGSSRLTFHESTKSILAGALESGFLLMRNIGTVNCDELFTLADENKNRLLLADMEENRSMVLSGVPDSIVTRMKGLKNEIVFSSRKYLKESAKPVSYSSGLNELQYKVIGLKLELDSLRKKAMQFYPEISVRARQQSEVTPSRIMKSLRDDEALLEYLCSDSVIYIFLLRHECISMKKVVKTQAFQTAFMECLRQFKGAGCRNFASQSQTLYKTLIDPVETGLKGIHRLIIIPDEELSLFPFEALIREYPGEATVPERTGVSTPSWHYLVKDFEIIYHFSAAAWLRDTANSNLPIPTYRYAGFSPVFIHSPANPVSFNPLPFATKEVNGIAALFGQAPDHQSVFVDTASTEMNFRLFAPGNSHIHIATHSIISDSDPENSALVFSNSHQPDRIQDQDDGLLHLDEISNLKLDASLVALSACATGEGKVTKTEGVLALTHGFYLAGASNVLYSLWSIPDHTTSQFMLDFYKGNLSGKSYGAALRDVKLKMISRPETSLPYMWAGIVLLGK